MNQILTTRFFINDVGNLYITNMYVRDRLNKSFQYSNFGFIYILLAFYLMDSWFCYFNFLLLTQKFKIIHFSFLNNSWHWWFRSSESGPCIVSPDLCALPLMTPAGLPLTTGTSEFIIRRSLCCTNSCHLFFFVSILSWYFIYD